MEGLEGLDLPMKVVDMFGAGIPVLAKEESNCIWRLVQGRSNGQLFETATDLFQQLYTLATGFPTHCKAIGSNSVDLSRRMIPPLCQLRAKLRYLSYQIGFGVRFRDHAWELLAQRLLGDLVDPDSADQAGGAG
ncbi:hypothetical protein OSTOST_11130 [Ostertagia ostertagi]